MFQAINENFPIKTLTKNEFPPLLKEINDPPKKLKIRGTLPTDPALRYLTVVGSRKHTDYGAKACTNLIEGLRGYPIVIVSGLAIGIDSIAHKTALNSNLITLAFPGSGLAPSAIYPPTHFNLAMEILEKGGALISELNDHDAGAAWMFPRRNRLMAGISHATLVIEASLKSGTLITSKLALEYNRDIFALPGSIYSQNSEGPNYLIKSGAFPIANSTDILELLYLPFEPKTLPFVQEFRSDEKIANNSHVFLTSSERRILEEIKADAQNKDKLIEKIGWPTSKVISILTSLELAGIIIEIEGKLYLKKRN